MKIKKIIFTVIPLFFLFIFYTGVPMAKAELKVGNKAPDFNAPSTTGKNISLEELKGKWVVLYFYPKSFTPGCTAESCSLRDGYKDIQKMNAVVLGVSLDGIETQKKFKEKYKLSFELLADTEKKISKAYDVLGFGSLYAKRKTFIINPEGKIVHIIDKVTTGSHDTQVLEILRKLQEK